MSWLGVNLIELGRTQSSRVNVGANSVGVNSAGQTQWVQTWSVQSRCANLLGCKTSHCLDRI